MPKAAVERRCRSCAPRSATAWRTRACMPPAAQLDRIRAFLEPVFARRYDAAASRVARPGAAGAARRAATRRAAASSRELTLDPPSSTGDLAGPPLLDEDWLVLSTIHSAKGLEWDVVHVIHAADGMIPSDMATGDDDEIEEERRLLYVALTRARDALHRLVPAALLPPAARSGGSRTATRSSRGSCPRRFAPTSTRSGPTCSPLPDADAIDGHRRRRRVPRRALGGLTGTLRRVPEPYDAVLLDLYDTIVWSEWFRLRDADRRPDRRRDGGGPPPEGVRADASGARGGRVRERGGRHGRGP